MALHSSSPSRRLELSDSATSPAQQHSSSAARAERKRIGRLHFVKVVEIGEMMRIAWRSQRCELEVFLICSFQRRRNTG